MTPSDLLECERRLREAAALRTLAQRRIAELEVLVQSYEGSRSWRLTRPLRVASIRRRRSPRSPVTEAAAEAISYSPEAPVVILSPHFDDALLSSFSVFKLEEPIEVVTVFAGRPPPGTLTEWDAVCGATDSHQLVGRRRQEDERALGLLGREPRFLPLVEGQYRESPPGTAEVARAIGEVVPSARLLCLPAGVGRHPDHLLVRRAALSTGLPVRLYADMPYCIRHGWPRWVTGEADLPPVHADVYWQTHLAGVVPDVEAGHVVRLTDGEANRKREALLIYETQMPALDYARSGVLFDVEILRFEVFWEVGRSL